MLQVGPVFRWSIKCAKTARGEVQLIGILTFSKIYALKSKKSLNKCRRCRWLQAETNAVAARVVTDRYTHRLTHKASTVTLAAHAHRGLMSVTAGTLPSFPIRRKTTISHLFSFAHV